MPETLNVPFDIVRLDIAQEPFLVIYGELDILTSPLLHEAFERLTLEAPKCVTVDVANVTFIDSSGLGALVVAKRHLEDVGSELHLAALPPSMAGLLEITGLSHLFDTDKATVDSIE